MRKLAVVSLLAILGSGATAIAGGNCGSNCYERVDTPPVYGTVAETVQVRPAQTYARHVPAQYGSVQETVVVRPEHRVARVIPAQYSTVAETVCWSASISFSTSTSRLVRSSRDRSIVPSTR